MELSSYVDTVYDQFRAAERQSSNTAKLTIRIADQFTVEVRFADGRLLPRFRSAIAHLECQPSHQPDLTICCWGDEPAQFSPYSRWGTPYNAVVNDTNCVVNCEPENGRLMVADWSKNIGMLWMRDFARFPWWEDARPFIDIIHWWLRQKGYFLVHAAAVGTANGAALIVGKGGSGKSTTALGCLASGLLYSSDDFCLIGKPDIPYVYAMYSSAKLETIESFPEFQSCVFKRTRVEGDKEILFFHPRFKDQIANKMPLLVILIPKICDQVQTTLVKSSHHAAVKALVPSTIEVLKGCDVSDFYGIFGVTKSIPAYTLELGTDRKQTVDAISELLQRLAIENARPLVAPKH